ncbi:putative bifunctional diguanylate cyclase/phosphodiesterase [Agitococcus lubricus]|uniref:cyclic-guanylate-specific phosphodiesterase n=1 Tax=Agitococcus lubricus TaxID=1077255 RepID=A0A2T5J370_9GAMM|nr:EAL domain-containing protein [Agitococcus lubricus]PTQ91055.1 diguanylate cyclase/phosphodiesterase with PAS/PAC sensor(s) [Agitococcus lubricus]
MTEQGQQKTPDTHTSMSSRLARLQSQQMINQFSFFSVISTISVLTMAALYWNDEHISSFMLVGWLWLALGIIGLNIGLMRHLQHQLKTCSVQRLETLIHWNAGSMGFIWGMATLVFVPSFPNVENNLIDLYRPALFACLISWQAIAALTCYASRFKTFIYFSAAASLPGLFLVIFEPSMINSSLAGVAGLFFFFVLLASRRLSELSYQSLWLQLRNEDLIRFLEDSKNTVETVNQRLTQEVQDRKYTENQLQEINLNLEQKVRERTLALSDINRALRNSQERLTLAIDASGIGLWDWNLSTNEIYHSNFEQLLGYSKLELKAFMGHMEQIIHRDDYPMVRRALLQHLRKKKPSYEVCYRIQHRAGHWVWVEDSGRVVAWDEKGHPLRLIGTRRDISPERETEEKLRLSASVFEHAAEGIYILDHELRYLSVNPRYSQITGFSDGELHGFHIFDERLNSFADKAANYHPIFERLKAEDEWQGELIDYRKNGQSFPQWLHITTVRDSENTISHYVGIVSDLTQRKESEEKLKYLANYDRLTGLANRNLFRDRLHTAMLRARDQARELALIYIDLDRFRTINDSLGHELGDELLKKVAERISAAATKVDTLARIGSDEFTLIVDQNINRPQLESFCEAIIDQLRRPFRVGEHELLLGASIGVSLFPDHGRELQILINHADLALQQAKRMGGNSTRFFSSDVRSVSVEQVTLESALRKAIFRDEFVVYYQPKLCLKTNRIIGTEALVRWQHPTMGLLAPGQFIHLAEEAGLISAIGEIVLDKACRQTKLWHDQGFGHICTSVNVVAQQLQRGNLLDIVDRVLIGTGLDPVDLELEITESSLMDDRVTVSEILEGIRSRGIKIALDDFGTGYSSLSYLCDFPIDIIKIDQSFVFTIGQNDKHEAIVRAIFAMGHSLGMKVVAEGVETQEHLDFLRNEGCDLIQGYLISRPIPADDLTQLLFKQQQLDLTHTIAG